MRYLNRVFLINSAQVKYAEVNLDGNVHFIGTQGVGKSTLLRAILFFYNADTLKLGIPKTKKSFLEYYFPYANSYIIYEVARQNGAFCVLAYKSSNKVCFRFIDSAYAQNHFINTENKAHESWSGIAQQLDANGVYYTKRKIDNYNDYRDILYGNNSGIAKELKHYALIESKDYQNIPRTIQNVFLNSELKAEFIKDTIIKSLGNDIQIDLSNYTHHLKGFELQLTEIKRFQDVKTTNQANAIVKLHIAIKHLEAEKTQLAKTLTTAVNANSEREPELSKLFATEKENEEKLQAKLKRASELFDEKEKRINSEISILNNYLKDARNKASKYAVLNIDSIIDRVSKKPTIDKEIRDLSDERSLITAQFQELTQKYQALQKELENQLSEFINLKEKEKLSAQASFHEFKSETTDEYERIFAQIKDDNSTQVTDARTELDSQKDSTNKLKIQREQIKQRRFYENEIESINRDLQLIEENGRKSENLIERFKGQIETLQKQSDVGEDNITKTEIRDQEKIEEKIILSLEKVHEIDSYLEASKTSLYGWLTQTYPGWENTIGKVIDEKNVLFNSDLSPKLTDKNSTSLFGVELDLSGIDKQVKTVAEYELEKIQLTENIENLRQSIIEFSQKSDADIENLRKKYRPRIREAKDGVKNHHYVLEQNISKKDEATVKRQDFIEKAQSEKQKAIEAVKAEIAKSTEEEILAAEKVSSIENGITKLIQAKARDRNSKIADQKDRLAEIISKIDDELVLKNESAHKRKEEIKSQSQNELAKKGADTKQLARIEERLNTLSNELDFIEKNRDTVAEFNKDKRELFDKVDEFKTERKSLDAQLAHEKHKSEIQKQSISSDLITLQAEIESLSKILTDIAEDTEKFEGFIKSECYATIKEYFEVPLEGNKTEKRVTKLIDEIKEIHYDKLNNRIENLRNSITGFLGKFSDENIFKFKKQGDDTRAFLLFAEDLSDFIEQDKIAVLEKEVNERFALIIQTIGKETTDLVSKEGEIQSVITKINRDFVERNFAGVIKKIALMLDESKNEVVQLLKSIKAFNDINTLELGRANLFSTDSSDAKNKKAIDLLKQFVKKIGEMRKDEITLSDSFELKFRIEENENDTGWVEKLSNVGSEGTDVLVKAMVNIMLLNVFKDGASKRFKDFRLHCMMDEIGKLHPNNVRGILKFANDRNILLINSSPTENDALAFKHIYKLEKDKNSITKVKRIITQLGPI